MRGREPSGTWEKTTTFLNIFKYAMAKVKYMLATNSVAFGECLGSASPIKLY